MSQLCMPPSSCKVLAFSCPFQAPSLHFFASFIFIRPQSFPTTNHLWTDAAFSYFNETGLEDIVMNPAKSPKVDGNQPSGDTGDGQQT